MGTNCRVLEKNRLRVNILFINVVTAVVPILLIGMIAYSLNYKSIKESVSDSVDMSFSQMNGRLEEYFDGIANLSKSTFYNNNIQSTWLTETDPLLKYAMISRAMDSYMQINHSVIGLSLLDVQDNVFDSSFNQLSDSMIAYLRDFDKQKLNNGQLFHSGFLQQNNGETNQYLAFRLIKSINQSFMKPIGIGVIILDRGWLDNMINDSRLGKISEVYVVDHKNQIIACTVKQKTGQYLSERLTKNSTDDFVKINGIDYMMKTSVVKSTGWKLVAVIPAEQLFREGRVLKVTITVIVATLFVIVITINLFMNLVITKPLKQLTVAFNKAAVGDWKAKVNFSEKNEITAIADHFNHMVSEIEALTNIMFDTQQKLYLTDLQKKQFELNGLQTQINSHFLYNTLHNLRGMAIARSIDDIERTIDNLVSFFRYNTKSGEYVLLRDEISHLETYAEIQNVRFGNRFKIRSDIEEKLLNYRVLKLILQPLVENAMFHGIEQKFGVGVIKISAVQEEDEVILKVLDNGKGMDSAAVNRMQEALRKNEGMDEGQTEKRSIGLMNINKRIKLYYGEKYGLQVKSWAGIGTAVSIIIPCDKREDPI